KLIRLFLFFIRVDLLAPSFYFSLVYTISMSLDIVIYILIGAAAILAIGIALNLNQKKKSGQTAPKPKQAVKIPEEKPPKETVKKPKPEAVKEPEIEAEPEAVEEIKPEIEQEIAEEAEPDIEPEAEPEQKQKKARLWLGGIFSSSKKLDDIYEELSNTLISADMGTKLAERVINGIKEQKPKTADDVKQTAKDVLVEILQTKEGNSSKPNEKPAVYLFVGVNGVGKTTTLGKIGKKMSDAGKKSVFAAADTFRAAAADQLTTWSQTAGAQIVKEEGADPASVAYKAVDLAKREGLDAAFVDTAGRLHNKANLIEELKKIVRVIEKLSPISETYLVLDAMTGQNGLEQAKVFKEAVNISGVILTKMDGTAKGGVIFSIQSQLGVGVKWIGLGEGADDLIEFSAADFVNSILD
ncbi:MAG: signal recognition particle-docking protein FtsY, partial [Bifidobacteriaceae bacterium]|nr:signal recognition particle-docking protein FtsY [Bifidobacteriaceae bacterium]